MQYRRNCRTGPLRIAVLGCKSCPPLRPLLQQGGFPARIWARVFQVLVCTTVLLEKFNCQSLEAVCVRSVTTRAGQPPAPLVPRAI
jgi:hypothetical protein